MTPRGSGAAIPRPLDITPALLALRPAVIWGALARQPIQFWAVFVYVFFEYVRPQSIYPSIDVIPFGQLTLLAAAGTTLLTSLGTRRWTAIDTGLLAFSVAWALSIAFAFDRSESLDRVDIFSSWLLVYFAISTAVNTQTRFLLLMGSWLLWNLKMSFFAFRSWASIGFAFRDWGVVGAPGWFANSGEFGIQMCVLFPISLYFALGLRRRVSTPVFLGLLFIPFTALAGAVASASRGAQLGMAVIALWILLRSRYKVRGLIGLAVLGSVFYFAVPEEQKARLSSSGEDETSQSRLLYWERGLDIAAEHPAFGIGYQNWTIYNASTWTGPRLGLPHNIFIECIAELGYVGFASLVFLLIASFWLNAKTRSLARDLGPAGHLTSQLALGLDGAMVGYMASGFFVTVLYYPYQWFNLAFTASLHLCALRARRGMQRAARAAATDPSPA
jgi:putative inorganic carbon (HCO3(-)) transporter